jgi:hypothetical protein
MPVMIGVDPHKTSHTAAVLDEHGQLLDRRRIPANLEGYQALRQWAGQWEDRRWAVEGAHGVGRPVAQRLAADGEQVVDMGLEQRLPQVKIPARGANCLVLIKVDADPAPSPEQSTAQGPFRAAHLHPSGVAEGHEPFISDVFPISGHGRGRPRWTMKVGSAPRPQGRPLLPRRGERRVDRINDLRVRSGHRSVST